MNVLFSAEVPQYYLLVASRGGVVGSFPTLDSDHSAREFVGFVPGFPEVFQQIFVRYVTVFAGSRGRYVRDAVITPPTQVGHLNAANLQVVGSYLLITRIRVELRSPAI